MVPNMSEEFGPDFITVTDEDGNEFELEHLDTLEYNGQTYMAFFPAVEDETGFAHTHQIAGFQRYLHFGRL